MPDLISISEAAGELRLHPSRVRALAASGELPAIKIGRAWAIDRPALLHRGPRVPGRPFAPQNAWALLFLASDRPVDWLDPSSNWRMREALKRHGLEKLLPRLNRRSEVRYYSAHPGEIPYVLDDAALVLSGVSAARSHELGLVSGGEVDAYVRASKIDSLEREHALRPASRVDSNVVLRLVPDQAWHLGRRERIAPLAAVAADLAEDSDPRSKRVGREALRRLSARH